MAAINDVTGDAIQSKINSDQYREQHDKIFGKKTDKNVDSVREKMRLRAEVGLSKYGVSTERSDLTHKQWLIHAQEEAMDLAIYLERIISDMPQ